MDKTLSITTTSLLLGLVVGSSVQAELYKVDPGQIDPGDGKRYYLHENAGFAAWYQDTHGRTLDLCLSRVVSSRAAPTPDGPAYMCLLEVEPGVYDDTQPLLFPDNFPSEAFWFIADAAIDDAATGISLRYGAQLEAAFMVEEPIEGHQISFSRIRVRVDLTTPGAYTITHPYGVEVFNVTGEDIAVNGGDGVINMTRDIGIGAPGVYSGALKGDVGPFLRGVGGPYKEGDETFIGDPNLEEPVTGSPFGTNYVRIQGPGGIDLRTDLFAVSGKLSDVANETPVIVQRASYSRQQTETGVQAREDVFVLAPPPPATASLTDTSGGEPVAMTEANATGNWYGQSSDTPTPLGTVAITVDNSEAIPASTPTKVEATLIDQVAISRAEYSLANATLTVAASSSDETGAPNLNAIAGDGAPIGALAGDGVLKTLRTGFTPIPPAYITVTSSNGGSDTEEVIILP